MFGVLVSVRFGVRVALSVPESVMVVFGVLVSVRFGVRVVLSVPASVVVRFGVLVSDAVRPWDRLSVLCCVFP